MHPIFRLIIFCCAATVLTACGMTSVVTRVSEPPKAKAFRTPQTIAIESFGGPNGNEAGSRLRQGLAASQFHTIKTDAGAADVVISGLALPEDFTSQPTQQAKDKCVSKDKKGKCTKEVRVVVHGLQEKCVVSLQVKALSRESSEVLFEKNLTGSKAHDTTDAEQPPRSKRSELCQEAFTQALENVVSELVPHTTNALVSVKSISDAGGFTDKAADLIKTNPTSPDILRAFQAVLEDPSLEPEDRQWAHYNLAVGHYLVGDYAACSQALTGTKGLHNDTIANLAKDCRELQ
jgi:hypothetical protein